MFQNNMAAAFVMLATLGGLFALLLFFVWRDRRKANQINLLEYKDDKDKARKKFFALTPAQRVELFQRELDKREDDLPKRK